MAEKLSHFDDRGRARMVDVGHKQETVRKAIARSLLKISPELVDILSSGSLEKGDAFTVAKTAGILSAKQTGQLIPMCHPLPVDYVDIEIELVESRKEVRIQAEVQTTAKTGVEMEAMVAVSVAGLTFYDMCKAVDKSIEISRTGLYRKTGGKSGEYFNSDMEWR
ncbi:MAG: cyclic pyranopterin monophosphate synthase MoaC [Proteobacteria bacterium]|nr:cyclic pyranopterin monophosphate synthase MoaC [Pseudomonadota bacterium]